MTVLRLLTLPLAAALAVATLSAPLSLPAQAAAPTIPDSPTREVLGSAVGADGTTYLVGNFTSIGAASTSLAALDSTSAVVNRSFATTNGRVYAMVDDGNGGLFVGGQFTMAGGLTRTHLAHILWDGSVDTTWQANLGSSDTVLALSRDDTVLYVGGLINSVNGTSRINLFAIDTPTAAVLPWTPEPDLQVNDLANDGTRLYVAGNFQSIGGQTRNRLAAFSLATGALDAWDPNADFPAYALALADDTVYVGGDFTSIGGATRNRLASVFKSTGLPTDWSPSVNGTVDGLALDGSIAYAVGAFTTAGVTTRNRAAAFRTDDAGTLTSWDPNLNGRVMETVTSPSGVYLGGYFSTVGGATSRAGLALVDKATGTPTSWNASLAEPGGNPSVEAFAFLGSSVVIGGAFSHSNTVPRGRAAAIDTSGRATSWDPNLNNEAYAITVSGTTAYIAGLFTSVNGGTTRNYAAAVRTDDTGTATNWHPDLNASAWSIAISNGLAYVGGIFTTVNGGTTRNSVAAFRTDDAGTATSWNPNLNGEVFDFAFEDDTAYMVGNFTTVGGTSRRFAAAVRTDDIGTLTPWNPDPNNQVRSLDKVGSLAYLGGKFTAVGGTSRSFAAAVRTDDTGTPTEWNPNLTCADFRLCRMDGDVRALDAQDGYVYIGGAFDTVAGVSGVRTLIAVSTSGTGARQTAWTTNFGSSSRQLPRLNTITATSSGVVVGGNFTQFALTGQGSYPPHAAVLPLAPTAPAAPTGVTATPVDTQASIAWTPGSNGGSTVTRVEFALDDTTTVDDSTTNTASPHTITGLTNGQSYVAYVRLVNAAGAGDWSVASAPFIPQATPPPFIPQTPGAPTSVAATPGNTTATVTWSPPADSGTFPIDEYVVRAQPGGQACSTASMTCTVTGLANGTPSTFTVTASSAAGSGPASAASAPVTPRTVPAAPTGVATEAGDAQATITWSPPSDDGGSPVTGYRVTTVPASEGCAVTGTTCSLDGLTTGTEYVVSVVATNAAGSSLPATAAVTPRGKASIIITGTRSRNDPALVKVLGTVTNLDVTTVQPYVRLGRKTTFQPSLNQASVGDEGRFRWQRVTSKRITVYVEAAGTTSNRVTVAGR